MSFSFWLVPGPSFHPFLAYFLWYVVCLPPHLSVSRFAMPMDLPPSICPPCWQPASLANAGGATNFPLWYGVPLLPYKDGADHDVYAALMAYTIVRCRLMNISVVLNKGLGYAIVLAIIVVATSIGAVLQQSGDGTLHSSFATAPCFDLCLMGAQQ